MSPYFSLDCAKMQNDGNPSVISAWLCQGDCQDISACKPRSEPSDTYQSNVWGDWAGGYFNMWKES